MHITRREDMDQKPHKRDEQGIDSRQPVHPQTEIRAANDTLLSYAMTTNQLPTAQASAAPVTGVAPLAVVFENVFDQVFRVHGSGINGPGRGLSASLELAY